MPGSVKADIKLGYFIGVGLVLLVATLVVAQMLLSRGQQQNG